MPNLTPNLNLKKPLLNEAADIDVLNQNFDTIDSAIAGKANATHTHTKANITDFAHTHTKANITDFEHTHTKANITDFAHTHTTSDITNIDNFVFGDNSSATTTKNPDTINKSGFYLSTADYIIDGISDWWLIIHVHNNGAIGYSFQIASSLQNINYQYCRSCVNNVWSPWARVWTRSTLGIGCKITHSLNQSIANNTWTTLNFDTEIFDDNNFHDTVTKNQRITITVKGRYLIGGVIQWDANSSGRREIGIAKNGTIITSISQSSVPSPDLTQMHCQIVDNLNIGDYLELKVFQSSDNAINVKSSNTSPYFYIVKVG